MPQIQHVLCKVAPVHNPYRFGLVNSFSIVVVRTQRGVGEGWTPGGPRWSWFRGCFSVSNLSTVVITSVSFYPLLTGARACADSLHCAAPKGFSLGPVAQQVH